MQKDNTVLLLAHAMQSIPVCLNEHNYHHCHLKHEESTGALLQAHCGKFCRIH